MTDELYSHAGALQGDDDVWVETTEPTHEHLCRSCGGVWSHEDEECPGPRVRHSNYEDEPDYDCPRCVDEDR